MSLTAETEASTRSAVSTTTQVRSRIVYLDGLRGVAIILVVLFHGYSRWSDNIPALKPFKNILLLNTMSAGVQLFFFISGFVILMTLQRKQDLASFIFTRWRRLFPAMLVCSIIIYATAGLLSPRPTGDPRLVDLLPGVTLLGDRFWDILRFVMVSPPRSIEGAFWSLYVEVIFYFVFGIVLLKRGTASAIRWLIWIGVVTSIFKVIGQIPHEPFTTIARIDKLVHISHVASMFGLTHYTWFAAGALAYLSTLTPADKRLLWGALACLAFGAATTMEYPVASGLVALIAAGAIVSSLVRRLLSLRVLTFMGFISYPLYLNHENMIVALMIQIQLEWPSIPAVFLPVLPIFVAGIIATIVARYLEPLTRRMIDVLIVRMTSAKTAAREVPIL